jgi:hypothetical protein
MRIEERILKDIAMFEDGMKVIGAAKLDVKEAKIIELALMYCNDAKSWLAKKDLYTAFASISYAHGLLDAVARMKELK